MAASRSLRLLLAEIKRVRSPLARVKLLARAWRTVRSISPAERREIAGKVGVAGLEGLLEKLGRASGDLLPEELIEIAERVDENDLKDARGLLESLRDPRGRKDLLKKAIDLMQEHLGGPEEPPLVLDDPQRGSATPREPTPKPAAPVVATTKSADPAVHRASHHEESPGPVRAAPARDAAPPPSPLTPLEQPPTGPKMTVTALPHELGSPRSLVVRFRALRRRIDDGSVNEAQVDSILAEFPEGWACRRALCSLIRAGLPGSTPKALSIILDLPRVSDRRWCAGELLHARVLTDEDLELIIENVPFASIRRRARVLLAK